jgi:hypothetical protein
MANEQISLFSQANKDALRLQAGTDRAINTRTASYTPVRADENKLISMNLASAQNTVTIPPNSSVPFQIGTELKILQIGKGQTKLVAGSGVTLGRSGRDTNVQGTGFEGGLYCPAQWAMATLKKVATDTWAIAWDDSMCGEGVVEYAANGNYTLQQGDKFIWGGGDLNLTIPDSSVVAFPAGWTVTILNSNEQGVPPGVSTITVTGSGDAAIDTARARILTVDKGECVRLHHYHSSSNNWQMIGQANAHHEVTKVGMAPAGNACTLETVGARRGWRIRPIQQSSYGQRNNGVGVYYFRTATSNQGVRTKGTYDATGSAIQSSGTGSRSNVMWNPDATDQFGSWVGVDFGAGVTKTITEIEIDPGQSFTQAEENPTRFVLEVTEGDNVTNWRKVCEFQTKASFHGYSPQIFTVPLRFQPQSNGHDVLATDTASRTLTGADMDRVLNSNHATVAQVYTIPPNSTVPFPIGAEIHLSQDGAAAASFTAGAGVTIQVPTGKVAGGQCAGQYNTITARKMATNTWRVGPAGDMA